LYDSSKKIKKQEYNLSKKCPTISKKNDSKSTIRGKRGNDLLMEKQTCNYNGERELSLKLLQKKVFQVPLTVEK
jgi:hypothetical protein